MQLTAGLWCGQVVAAKMLVVHDDPSGIVEECHAVERRCAILEAAVGTALGCHPNVVTTYAYNIVPLDVEPDRVRGQQEQQVRQGQDVHHAIAAAPWAGGSDVFQLCILQELCSGGSLKDMFNEHSTGVLAAGMLVGGLAAVASLRFALDVALGLRHVHAAGIVHGDISAGNILLARREPKVEPLPPGLPGPFGAAHNTGDDDSIAGVVVEDAGDVLALECSHRLAHTYQPPLIAKVADFGLSVRVHGRTHASNHFQGTPLYVAPEVYGLGRVSKASDTYSFGVLLVELIHSKSISDIWRAHVARPLDAAALLGHGAANSPLLAALHYSLRDAAGSLPLQLQALVASCLAPVAAHRPTMEQIITSLVDIMLMVAT
ncbi:putative LRR receptor-like serine/threonine-protein kinase [Tetrabaena socialis]|uniref:Putative LRR receptor-like serine/threonine-protein kinase n=1 Tax=Tetrabaena socialis TaxID=47790 RepID=A0A2J8A566_9CHLO|nr:putative LRR receptor-like serine/threonine-protein kinase [Tetrabaena socialis]|eukprot:PNH07664.1 putative LRR receptor-like serine/threonine-protein kinase [Tetrabaena socialis]